MHFTKTDAVIAAVLLVVSQVEVWGFGQLGGTPLAAGVAAVAAVLMLLRSSRPLLLAIVQCALYAFAAQLSLAQEV